MLRGSAEDQDGERVAVALGSVAAQSVHGVMPDRSVLHTVTFKLNTRSNFKFWTRSSTEASVMSQRNFALQAYGIHAEIYHHSKCSISEEIVDYCKWTIYTDQHRSGSTQSEVFGTLQECIAACRARSDCRGVDYDLNRVGDKSCWYHTTALTNPTTQLSPQTGTNYYSLDSCDGKLVSQLYAKYTLDKTG